MNEPPLPLARWINTLVEEAMSQGSPAFESFGNLLGSGAEGLQGLIAQVPPLGLIALFAGLGYWRRGWGLALFSALAMAAIHSMGFGPSLAATLAQILMATLAAVTVGIPLGIWLGGAARASRLARPVLDLMQTMPAFVYLIPAAALFGLGLAPALLATMVFSLPPVVRLTAMGIHQVGGDVVEAATNLGARPWQVLWRIRIPYALPAIMAGISQSIMMALSMVIIASMVGAGGLGNDVLSAIQRLDIGQGVASGCSVVLLAMVVDRLAESFIPPDLGAA
jgi:glycine betaine/proline transport system permease protein